jgi:hypothetical protein
VLCCRLAGVAEVESDAKDLALEKGARAADALATALFRPSD